MKIEKLSRWDLDTRLREQRWAWTPLAIVALVATSVALICAIPFIYLTEDCPHERIGEIADVCVDFGKLMFHWVD